ncbi:hypothetical protein B0H14DRAFT_3456332 [Mycena olivaceomarginata]|nr:hypothetical protein B0H14DRAFT_3456332 [Mycena olivaceomarginata]
MAQLLAYQRLVCASRDSAADAIATWQNNGTVRFRPSHAHQPATCPSHALRGTPNWDPVALYPQLHITFVGIGTRPHVAFVGREVHPYIAFVGAEAHPHVVFVGPVDRFCQDRTWVWPAWDRGFVLPLFFKTAAGGPQVFINAAPNVQPEPTVL